MPYSLNINSYPLHLYAILEAVLFTQKEVIITADNKAKAEKIRRQVFGLKNALLASKEHPLKESAAKITTELADNILYIRHIDAATDPAIINAAKQLEE